MDSVVIPPASASTNGFISTSEHNHGRGHGDHGHHDRDWPERTSERVRAEVFDSERTRAEEVRDILGAVERSGAANSLATEKTSGAVTVAVERIGAAGQLATNVAGQQVQNLALSQFNLLQVQAQTFAAANLLEQVKNAGASALAAATNTAAILAAHEKCCCEIKERIREDGEATRLLISANQATNLAVQLSDAKAELLLARSRLPIAA